MNQPSPRSRALRFVLLVGVMSLFADAAYEGARGIIGPYLGALGASAFAVGLVTGLGEMLGYGLRLVSGRAADRTHLYWPITIFGYVVQMTAVPALALAGSWYAAAVLIILERVGKAIRNPPRDVMLSHAGKEMGGFGWAFGLHEALDQLGALCGPLVMAWVLAKRGSYPLAFATLLVPAIATLAILAVARVLYPRPHEMEANPPHLETQGLPKRFWIYLAGAALVGAGLADFPFIAFHFQKSLVISTTWIPVLYSVAMGVSGVGSLVFGWMFDRFGLIVVVPLTVLGALFAPLVFLWGSTAGAIAGVVIWGLGMGVHESIVPAAVAPMVPVERRASAYGLFTAGYGICWFLGSALIGLLYQWWTPGAAVVFCIAAELAAVPFFIVVWRASSPTGLMSEKAN